MRKWTWFTLLAAALTLGIGGAVYWLGPETPEWTTSSPEALAEMRLGLESSMRFYENEARAHFDRALELDANFVAARLRRLPFIEREDKDKFKAEIASLKAVDREPLSDRERFLLDYSLTRVEKEHAKGDKLLTAYLERYPRDPFVLSIRCNLAFQARRSAQASDCLRRLLAIDPNWAMAQNQLGYIAMAEGRFEEAEELFKTYLFIASEQANPHDSMAELLILRGRYDEAERQLVEAVRIRPDFCIPWRRRIQIQVLRGDGAAALAAFEKMRVDGQCRKAEVEAARCYAETWEATLRGALEEAWQMQRGPGCADGDEDHAVAVRFGFVLGHDLEAREMLAAVRERDHLYGDREPVLRALVQHLSAIEIAAGAPLPDNGPAPTEPWRRVADFFAAADRTLSYQGADEGNLKLFNRLDWARVLADLGQTADAEALRSEVEAVNPAIAKTFHGFPRNTQEWRRGGWPPAARSATTTP